MRLVEGKYMYLYIYIMHHRVDFCALSQFLDPTVLVHSGWRLWLVL